VTQVTSTHERDGTLLAALVVDADGEPIRGELVAEGAEGRVFCGWIELASAIDAWLAASRGSPKA
jgi:hypothetical protein